MAARRRRAPDAERLRTLVERTLAGVWLWPVLGTAVGLSGGRRSRRGALRGLLALAVTELLGRRLWAKVRAAPVRPAGRLGALRPRTPAPARAPRPAASTFASAFALSVGAAQEDPARGAALLPLAAGLGLAGLRSGPGAWSAGLPDGRRAAREALTGAALGSAVAVATRRLWKVAPGQPARARRVWTPVVGQPEPEGDGLVVVVNPLSGPAWSGDPTEELRAGLPRAEVLAADPDHGLGELLARAETGGARALGVAGGDGTVCAAVEAALRADLPLLVVPAGTLNHFARDLGVETTADAVEAVRAGELVAVDVGTIDGRPFVNTASFGSYADLVDTREQLETRIGKWPAVLVALTKVLWRGRPVEVEIDGERTRVWMIFIGNCCYQPAGLAPSWRERLDDGLLDIRLVDGTSPFSRTRLLLAALTGRLARTPVYQRRVVGSLRIRSREGPLRLARDGETFDGGADVTVAKQPGRLRVFRPVASG